MDYKFLLGSILKYLDEGVIVVDTKANITFFNEPAKSVAGIEPENALGKNILEVFKGLSEETSTFYYVLKNKKPLVDYVQSYQNSLGKHVTTVTSTIPLIKDGQLIGALEIYRKADNFVEFIENISKINEKSKAGSIQEVASGRLRKNGTSYTLDDMIGESLEINLLKKQCKKVSDSISPVFVYGETGTGKELLVQGIHNSSSTRANKPFVAQNCAAIPNSLLESILFGTSIGSFTGAKDSPGLFELADGGTLFLDEINSMDFNLQAKLLRVLQDGVIRRVGDNKTVKVDVRVIVSTNEEPELLLEEGKIRKDLYYRLNVLYLKIPPLRDRKKDIPLLVRSFIKEYNEKLGSSVVDYSDDFIRDLINYDWPGNIRELKYMIERIMNLTYSSTLTVEDIPKHIMIQKKSPRKEILASYIPNEPVNNLNDTIKDIEKRIISDSIINANGNCSEAARKLGIPKQTMHNKIKKHGISIGCKIE